jgi:hypothetical protein
VSGWLEIPGPDRVSYGGLILLWMAAGLTLITGLGLFSQGDAISQGNAMKLDIHYFAWLRERLGTGRETVETEAAPSPS